MAALKKKLETDKIWSFMTTNKYRCFLQEHSACLIFLQIAWMPSSVRLWSVSCSSIDDPAAFICTGHVGSLGHLNKR